MNLSTILKKVLKSQEKRTKEERKSPTKQIQNSLQNGNKIIHIVNYLKCK